jgi:hypothetical protein
MRFIIEAPFSYETVEMHLVNGLKRRDYNKPHKAPENNPIPKREDSG